MYKLEMTKEQREMLQSILCDVVLSSRDEAMEMVGFNDKRALRMLKKSADADKIWTLVNQAEEV